MLGAISIAGAPGFAFAKGGKDASSRKGQAQEAPGDGEVSVAEEARIACLAGDWQKGVRLLAEAYVATKEPTWLYNQGRCYQQSNQGPMAITRFRDFLRVAAPESPLVAKAKAYIAEIEADAKKAEPAAAPAPAPAPTIVVQPAPVQVTTTPVVVTTSASPVDSAPPRSFAAKATTVSLIGVGAVGLGLGIFSSLKIVALESDATKSGVTAGQLAANESEASRYETLQWIGYGVGAAAIVGAGVVYAMSGRRGADGATSARADRGHFAALWNRGTAGLLWEGSF